MIDEKGNLIGLIKGFLAYENKRDAYEGHIGNVISAEVLEKTVDTFIENYKTNARTFSLSY